MASPSAPVHPARYLAAFLVLLIGAYLLVFLTGDKHAKPKLGIDLQGGTRVTLTARTPDGSKPTKEALTQAQQIINARVNGLGVSGSEVIIDGDNLVITVPGNDGSEARNLGQTAKLYIRPVIQMVPAQPRENPQPGAPQGGQPGGAGQEATPPEPGGGKPAPAAPSPKPQPRPYPAQTTTMPPPPPPAPATQPATPNATTSPAAPPADLPPKPGSGEERKQLIDFEKQIRQSEDPRIQMLALQVQSSRCFDPDDPLAGNDDPNLPLVTCGDDSQGGKAAYLLDKSIISGEEIKDASSGLDQQRGIYVVSMEFKPTGAKVWADYTSAHWQQGTQTAFTLDSKVISAPAIREPIPGGKTEISGQFTSDSAKQLAAALKYGSLPLSFESSDAETVSATLGLTSLKAGLIAGAIGLAIVLLYSLIYYRVLGILTALSLVASGAMVFAILVLLGRYISYTLDLAGIAGLIIGIGTTADSFVVFFERIKDEIREGRSYRSAVPRGWARARKTILSGNAVTLLAAVVLYALAIGQVKGFAFTLGLTTILDVVVVFLVTWPLVYLSSKSATLSKPVYNGLGAVQQIARERKAAAHA
ncbi:MULTISPECIES: protein translocase subunit SecD [Mycobacteroides]|uniref:Protein translocase subunit SecD n=1 Tax=Mycobacteroides chelonae TaxID=1774 RepID=A0A1S1LZW5_MYCCH|nr:MULTISPECIES: protein translocase subunit SecD [Mycobacteroides]KRQ25932.1 preprotein translocase subunit SecD [Mycobacteroides sp. H003]KRQ35057.1 preprotein translocase subunit SecD [Mycobacteroides sp. H092]KRQ39261.1 preprotein translocase subunit SecD [Mycobacteroides sp. H101]KRQ48637.1 preprotein translocase subunit SecD [Mycobacteroides sp. H063]KRQ58814.1 preprotein translocase subunit SecD [Mycobacteroides sp. HXVII]